MTPGSQPVDIASDDFNEDGVFDFASVSGDKLMFNFAMPTPTTVDFTGSPIVREGSPVTLTVSVPGGDGGIVDFLRDGQSVGGAYVVDGYATLTTNAWPVGNYITGAQYYGNGDAAMAFGDGYIDVRPAAGYRFAASDGGVFS